MARKYEVQSGKYAWNLDKCEEVIFIAAYNDIAKFVPPDAQWPNDLECTFYQRGVGLSFSLLGHVNSVRKQKRLSLLVYRETDISDYGKTPDKVMKAEHRRKLRDDLGAMSEPERKKVVEAARAEMEAMEPPHANLRAMA